MPYSLQLNEEAFKEYIETYSYYELRKPGLGDAFMKAVDGRMQKIAQHPEYYSLIKANYRQVKVPNFPYVIVYEIFKQQLIIHIAAIFHGKRNPKLKFRKLK